MTLTAMCIWCTHAIVIHAGEGGRRAAMGGEAGGRTGRRGGCGRGGARGVGGARRGAERRR